MCTDNFTCCHTEIEAADPTFHLTQSQCTDTGPTSPSADPITPGAWQGSHWSANFEVTGMTGPRKNPGASGIRTRDLPLSRRTPKPLGQRGGLKEKTLFVVDDFITWATGRRWQTKVLDTCTVTQLNILRQESVKSFLNRWRRYTVGFSMLNMNLIL